MFVVLIGFRRRERGRGVRDVHCQPRPSAEKKNIEESAHVPTEPKKINHHVIPEQRDSAQSSVHVSFQSSVRCGRSYVVESSLFPVQPNRMKTQILPLLLVASLHHDNKCYICRLLSTEHCCFRQDQQLVNSVFCFLWGARPFTD